MKRFVYLICLLVAACSQVNYPNGHGGTGKDDFNPIHPIPAAGASFMSNLQTYLSAEASGERTEYGFKNFVVSGCLGATAAGLTHTPSSCIAYNANIRGTETGAITYPNNSTIWVAMDENTSGANAGLPNFSRVSGEHYLIDSVDSTQPAMVSDSQLLMKVTTAGGAITAVQDLRQTGSPLSVPINQAANQTGPYNGQGQPFTNLGGITSTGTTSLIDNQYNGAGQISNLNLNGVRDVSSYGVLSSCTGTGICLNTTTTAQVLQGDTIIPVGSVTNLAVGNYISLSHAGPPCGTNWNLVTTAPSPPYTCANAPTTPTLAMFSGTGGAQNYYYEDCVWDGRGGYGACSPPSSLISGPASINKTNSIKVTTVWGTNSVPGACIYRSTDAVTFNLVGKTGHRVWIDDGQEGTPPINDFDCPATAPVSGANEHLISRVTAINGLNVTVANAAGATVASPATFLTDDDGMVQQAVWDSESAPSLDANSVITLGRPLGTLSRASRIRGVSAVITGPNTNGLTIIGRGASFFSEQYCGPTLWVGADYTNAIVHKLRFDDLYFQGTGMADSTRPCQSAAWQFGAQGVDWNRLIVETYPSTPVIFDKPDISGASFASDITMENPWIKDMGDGTLWAGLHHGLDDIAITHWNGADSGKLTNGDAGTSWGDLFIAATNVQLYWGENNTEGAFTIGGAPASQGFEAALQVKGAVSGGIWGWHSECNGAGSAARGQDILLNNVTAFNVQGVQSQETATGCTAGTVVKFVGSSPSPVGNSVSGVDINDSAGNTLTCGVDFNSKTGNEARNITLAAGPAPSTAYVCSPAGNLLANIGGVNAVTVPSILARNAAGSADIQELTTDASNNIKFGDATNAALILLQNLAPPRENAIGSIGTCSAASEGAHAVATDCNAGCSAGGTCTTGAATHCEMYCDGTNWKETGR